MPGAPKGGADGARAASILITGEDRGAESQAFNAGRSSQFLPATALHAAPSSNRRLDAIVGMPSALTPRDRPALGHSAATADPHN
ncbi:hypothetical protein EVAR_67562_1 [Eumeta japonica]|uniref:Uncharacterized protein n=1 Tax=Eumeta variegata TaxID=151549 RepID=A0A4C1ZF01_EUMVA|nr:hypothetical protein EVAR_67562_1 [Eumeta japonica]